MINLKIKDIKILFKNKKIIKINYLLNLFKIFNDCDKTLYIY